MVCDSFTYIWLFILFLKHFFLQVAKATAKEAGMRFINLDASALTDKWYGESQKLATAVFSLAVKIQPCIIFIDEIDSLLRSRDTHDHEGKFLFYISLCALVAKIIRRSKF